MHTFTENLHSFKTTHSQSQWSLYVYLWWFSSVSSPKLKVLCIFDLVCIKRLFETSSPDNSNALYFCQKHLKQALITYHDNAWKIARFAWWRLFLCVFSGTLAEIAGNMRNARLSFTTSLQTRYWSSAWVPREEFLCSLILSPLSLFAVHVTVSTVRHGQTPS